MDKDPKNTADLLSQEEASKALNLLVTQPVDQNLLKRFSDFLSVIVARDRLRKFGTMNYIGIARIIRKYQLSIDVPMEAGTLNALKRQPFFTQKVTEEITTQARNMMRDLITSHRAPSYVDSRQKCEICKSLF